MVTGAWFAQRYGRYDRVEFCRLIDVRDFTDVDILKVGE